MLFIYAQNRSIEKFPNNLSEFYDELIDKIVFYNEERKIEFEDFNKIDNVDLPLIAFKMNEIRSGIIKKDYIFGVWV